MLERNEKFEKTERYNKTIQLGISEKLKNFRKTEKLAPVSKQRALNSGKCVRVQNFQKGVVVVLPYIKFCYYCGGQANGQKTCSRKGRRLVQQFSRLSYLSRSVRTSGHHVKLFFLLDHTLRATWLVPTPPSKAARSVRVFVKLLPRIFEIG